MIHSDIVIIGAGLLGCFAARALTAYDLSVTVLEQREDVCTGISRANTGIVYTGCDTKPGTLKTGLCVRANENFAELCQTLDVPFRRPGSLMVSFGERADGILRKKYEQGQENGVNGLELLDREETLRREPNLAPHVRGALYAPGTGVVNPWELGIAAYENAVKNGAVFRFRAKLLHILREGQDFLLESAKETYRCRAVLNCAGLCADAVREMTETPLIRIMPSAADYLVLDTTVQGYIGHVIFHEPERKGKGLTLVPTVDGNLLVGPTEYDFDGQEPYATTAFGLNRLRALCEEVVPGLPLGETIRNFGSLRPSPYEGTAEGGVWVPKDRSISNFTVLEENGLFSLIGIKTPGLTCAAEVGGFLAEKLCAYLGCDRKKTDYDPVRRGIPRVREMDTDARRKLIEADANYGRIVCRCCEVTKGEILEAIARGACTVDGVKRRTRAGMGRCQGGYCMQQVMELLTQTKGVPASSIQKDGAGTWILRDETV